MKRFKQLLSSLLVFAMVWSIAPTVAFAANDDNIVTYDVEGGNIYFDTSTGTVTKSDKSVTTANIPAQIANTNVKHIGMWSFQENTDLVSVQLPSSILSIEQQAFKGCTNLKSINLPDSITDIAGGVFEDCTSLNNISIPNSVSSIGANAFKNCSSLNNSLNIPNGITMIKDGTFDGCSNLSNITIPNSVTTIAEWAFAHCDNLSNIEIPNGVTSIGAHAFSGCGALNSINLPDGITTIEDGTFNNCFALTSIAIPNGVTSVGKQAFYFCDNLTNITIPNSVTSIGEEAFARCDSLSNINISANVASIGNNAFGSCGNLNSINVATENTNYCSDDGILFNKDKTTLIQYPAGKTDVKYEIPSGVLTINENAFDGSNFSELSIPNSVLSINNDILGILGQCKNLAAINVDNENPNYSAVDGVLFNKDKTSLILYPVAKENATYNIPSSVNTIEKDAFANCNSLNAVNIPDSVTSIGNQAFIMCENLNSVTIPNSVTSIGGGAFFNCSGLHTINIPTGVTSIESGVFQGAGLTSVTIPAGVTNIKDVAFSGCEQLKTVVIPDSVTEIGYKAFVNCDSLTDVYYGGSETQWNAISINENDNGTAALKKATIHYNSTGPVEEKKDIQNTDVTGVQESYTYTGGAITPDVVVKDGSSTLVAGTDYEVSYSNNETCGTATITITGKGRYTGQKTVTFEITKAVLTITAKDKTITYGDVPANDGVTITGLVNGDNESIVTGLEYSYDYEPYGNVGTYTITPKAATAGNYDIKFVAGKLTVEPKTVGLTWNDGNLYYNGKAKNVSAEATGTVNSDEIKVTVTGGNTTEIGAYTASATGLTGAKAANYALPTDTAHSYSIVSALNNLRVEPNTITATVEGLTIKLVGYATGEITISADDAVVDGDKLTVHGVEYTIDKSGVKEIPAEVEIETPTSNVKKAEGATIDDSVVNEINSADTKGEGLNAAAADTIAVADKTITAEDKANAVTKVKVQTVLDIRPKSYANGELTMNIEPKIKYIYVKVDNTVFRSTEPEKLDNSSIKAPITINVKLPSGFEPNFAKHGSEMIPVTVSNGVATWQQSSFSDVTLVSDKRAAVITFQFADGHTQTIRYTAANIGDKLPTDSKSSSTFKGWKIGDTIYTTLTDEALTALNGSTKTLTAEFTANSGSNGGGSSSGGSSGGGAAATDSYSITVKNVQNGTVTVSHKTAAKNTTVTITATPDKGYILSSVKVLDQNNKEVKLNQTNGKYIFIMPNSKVTVTPTFVAEATKPVENHFVDVADNAWYAEAVYYVADKGMMNGIGENKFAPNATTTRGMLMTVLARYAGQDTSDSNPWYQKGMDWAMHQKVSDGTNPTVNITREQLVTMLYRYAGSPVASGSLSDFSDTAAVSDYAASAMQWAVANNIVNGTNGNLNPKNNATRAEVAAILMRFCAMTK